ncbi:MAG: hypothetical protein F4Y38_06050 [Gemmatimonadetes bacterium]|nr:hypothetical protein [Gemmatimonadota bacterium]MYG85478.1 hypothetical protein [Gemmatimonadota bacterium]MYJ88219.1 hypothetical protein [Gemmatimonadota bacterium]
MIPAMMERELARKYRERASEARKTFENAVKIHPVSSLGFEDLPSGEELEEQCLAELQQQWEVFKEHFIVEMLPLVGSLEEVVNWYFAVKPPFASGKKQKEFPDALILSALDQYHHQHGASIAIVTADQVFKEACQPRPYINHYSKLADYIRAFEPEFKPDTSKIEPVDLSSPIVTEDLTVLKEVLGRGSSVTQIEIDRVIMLLRTHGTNYTYFFLNCSDPDWLSRLKNDYFQNPPSKIVLPDGTVQYPSWPELFYLQKICQHVPDDVIDIVLELPKVDNPRIYEYVLEIALSLDGGQAVSLQPKILEYASLSRYLIPHRFAEILAHWTTEDQTQAALDLTDVLIQFQPDPQAEDKYQRKAEYSQDDVSVSMDTMLETAPLLDDWNYQQVMEKGVRPLVLKEPFKVARMLIDATANLIRLGKHQDEIEQSISYDSSEVWCPKLEEQRRENAESKETLVNTLTYACKEVFAQLSRATIASLDRVLRNQRWQIFVRLRQHLYTLYPNEQTKPWVQELILGYNDYAEGSRYPYEFQRMIRTACEHYGAAFLKESDRIRIFDLIVKGPELATYREWFGDQFSERDFEQWKREYHRLQLRPFASVLFGDYASYYQSLASDDDADEVSDDTYLSVRVPTGGFFSYRSPKTSEELSTYSDEEILEYINAWQDEHSDKDNWLIKVNIPALAGAFQSVFIKSIIPDDNRLSFWLEQNCDLINRPIYVEYMIQAMQTRVEAGNFDQLNRWFDFCKWVLSHLDEDREATIRYHDRLGEDVSWRSSRRAVGDLVGMCLKEENNVPISNRVALASLLEILCTQFDYSLDRDQTVLRNPDDPFTYAINTTRGRALEHLVDFGLWVRRYNTETDVSEITLILEQRFKHDARCPLTIPEYALLGRYFPHLHHLSKPWAENHKPKFFPRDNMPVWLAGFGSLLIWNNPYMPIFEVIHDDYKFALDHMDDLKKQSHPGREAIDVLGEHLFVFYVRGVFPLSGCGSLLERFYQRLNGERERWAILFDYVGRQLNSTGKRQVDETLWQKISAFFDWRLKTGEPKELREYTFWMKSECLEADWRLDAYTKILNVPGILDTKIGEPRYASLHIMALRKMIPEHTAKVVFCFAKLIQNMPTEGLIYVPPDDTKAILKAGLNNEDENVRRTAEEARETILRGGQFGFLDLDD